MKRNLVICFLLLSTNTVFSQIIFDLSDQKTKTETVDIGKSILIVKNMSINPTVRYSISVQMKQERIPSFSTGLLAGAECEETNATKAYRDARDKVLAITNETELPKNIEALKSEIGKLGEQFQSCKEQGNRYISLTSFTKDLQFSLKNNQTITVIITKNFKAGSKDTSATFTKEFKTPEKSPWLTHFGFTYQPNIISKYDQFFTKQKDASDTFNIIRKYRSQTRFWENLTPTIMFSYPITNKEGESHLAISAIASTNFSLFSAGTGLSAIIGHNYALGVGFMFTQKNVLRGEYKADGTEIVKQAMTFDQLHEKKWGPEIYFTIALRFDKSPFSGGKTSNTGTTTPPANNQ